MSWRFARSRRWLRSMRTARAAAPHVVEITVRVKVPPLRERPEDIPLLVASF